MKTIISAGVFAAILLAVPSVSQAGVPTADRASAVVPYGDLDLRTPDGAAKLRRRVDATVIALSRPVDPNNLSELSELAGVRRAARRQVDGLVRSATAAETALAPVGIAS